jgi:hypothetical protein
MDESELRKCLSNFDYLAKKFFNQKYCMAYDAKA